MAWTRMGTVGMAREQIGEVTGNTTPERGA